ncbi:MAG: flagellar basal-body rod protein FlgB [Planctomycetaceae bacterium]|jgi:flagellar basal-body rod protein FlgB|nr:flagellar basal-body rod protein FlgB [Planctomycetaceae bacterium]MCH2595585.1 flagellar basal body protein [Pirellulales bacterium]HCK40770.1 flagellar basal body rod protein FlgB [Planctomycetaceae bacterium]|tara:strand:+ start:990 stop:1424 length:435 start_codon:yes stop_codon:yes gene_type:complete
MFSSLINTSNVPVLEQVVAFTQTRHGVLAGNIANIDTPGYQTRDLSPELFQDKLKDAIEYRQKAAQSPTYAINAQLAGRPAVTGHDGMDQVRESMKHILFHDKSDVSIEKQVAELSKNQAQHNLALSLMTAQFRLLRAAITERA